MSNGLQTITRERVFEQIVNQVVDLIRQNKYRAGDPLPSQRGLAEQFGVSRTAVREAMSVLEKAGLIEVRPGARTIVGHGPRMTGPSLAESLDFAGIMDKGDLQDLMDLRLMFEGDLAYEAAEHATDDELAAIKRTADDLARTVAEGRLGADEDYAFHERIARACHNAIAYRFWGTLSDLVNREILHCRLRSTAEGRTETAAREHLLVAGALLARDAAEAREMMRRHLIRVKNHFGV
ncbi:MAG TPA: FadR/GntR family transcriptional regulator [Bacillota bacterium]